MAKVYVDRNGYKRYADSGKPVHRHVAEQKLGRSLRPGEVVHHKNREKTDNSRRNLWVFGNQGQHDRAHETDARKYGEKYSYQGKKKKNDW